jgi:hypothetical protein
MSKPKPLGVPADVAAIRRSISEFFSQKTEAGLPIGTYYGVYVFFDYDEEPIYVGQSYESLRSRVGRHMTNQRTDAVAMNVLDPFEVAWIEVYPLHHKKLNPPSDTKALQQELNALEYTVFQKVLRESALKAVLNEGDIAKSPVVKLPKSYKARIIPDQLFEQRKHPDIRIARRANTIARLAQVISERDVSAGLRRTLLTQARRLEKLARERFEPFASDVPVEHGDEELQAK